MIRIAHESPVSIFDEVSKITDIDYALVHLFEENEQYYKIFKDSVDRGREVILDNSIFELGTAFNSKEYVEWIKKLNPSWYIIPDVLEDGFGTIESFNSFKQTYKDANLPGKTIAVAQGRTICEMLYCFEYLHKDSFVDMVALSFDLSFYERLGNNHNDNKLYKWMRGRQFLISYIDELYKKGVFYKPVHLLGTALPQEGMKYKQYDWIYSVDTSNPVVHGFEGDRYNDWGLDHKSSVKLYTIIDSEVNDSQLESIKYNISEFRKLWS